MSKTVYKGEIISFHSRTFEQDDAAISHVVKTSLVLIHILGQIMCQYAPKDCGYKRLPDNKVTLDCSNSILKTFQVPQESYTDPKIESLILSNNQLKSLNGSEISIYAPNLVITDLNRNKFEIIENDTFQSLIHLQTLMITNNRIRKIESDSFNHLPNLNKLYLWGNKLQFVKDIWFRNLNALKKLDIRQNLIEQFRPSDFRWPKNLETLLLQHNSFHVIPPIPQNVKLMNITENRIDCSCQRKDHQEVDKDVLLKVHVTCEKTSTGQWRKQHFDNPYCVFPTVHVVYEEIKDGEYIVNCTGYGFPLPRVSLKNKGNVISNMELKSKIVFGPVMGKNITCTAHSSLGITKAMWNKMDDGHVELTDSSTNTFKYKYKYEYEYKYKYIQTHSNTTPQHTFSEGDFLGVFHISISFIFYIVTMFVSSAFTNVALVVSLYIFISYFRQLDTVQDL